MSTEGLNGRDDITVGFGASTSGLASGARTAVDLVKDGTAQMRGSFGALEGAVGKLTGGVLALVGVMAGGRMFSAAITETVKLAGDVASLSKLFRDSAGEASGWAQALDKADMTTDTLSSTMRQLVTQVRNQEDAVKAAGMVTRGANGEYLNQKTLLFNALDAVKQYKQGTDQLMAAQVLFGRGIDSEVIGQLFRMRDALADGRKEAEAAGLVMGVENVKAARDFTMAGKDVNDALAGIKVTIGNAILPVFTELKLQFASAATGTIPALQFAFRGLGVVLLGIVEVLYGFWNVFSTVIRTVVVGTVGIVDALTSLMSGDVAGAKTKWAAMTDMIATEWEDAGKRVEAQSKRSRAAMDMVWNGPTKVDDIYVPPSSGGGNKRFTPFDKNASKDQLELFKKELELLKQAQGDYVEYSKQAEVEFWRAKLALFKKGTKEWYEVNTLYLKARRDAAKEGVEIQKFELESQIQELGNNLAEKVRLTTAWQEHMATLYGKDSKEYREATRAKLTTDRELRDQQRQFENARAEIFRDARYTEIDIAREQMGMLVEMGLMSKAAQVALEKQAIEEKYNIALADLARKQELYADDVAMQEQVNNERRRLDSELQRELARNSIEGARATRATITDMIGNVFSTLESVTMSLLSRTMTWKQAMLKIADSLLQGLVGMGVARVRDWVLNELMMTAASKTGTSARAASAAASSAAVMGAKASEGATVIATNAAEAATGAAASQAAIPVIGPALAFAAAAAMMSFVMGFGGKGGGSAPTVPSAQGGWWDIPRDTLAMVHAEEMIMPPELSRGVRELVEAGGARGGSTSVHIQAIDGASVASFFQRHAATIAPTLATYSAANNVRTRR